MNKTHFQHSLEEMQAQHNREMTEQAKHRAEEDSARDKEREVTVEKMKQDMETLKKELQVSQLMIRWHRITRPADATGRKGAYEDCSSRCGSKIV